VHDCKADFKPEEAFLQSMTTQLKALGLQNNDKSQYKADGLIKLYGIKDIEVLLLENSGSLNNSDKVKINYDHHKDVFVFITTVFSLLLTSKKKYYHSQEKIYWQIMHGLIS
jgi:hypothetical protein